MARPTRTSPDRELRRLALAERWDDVRALLMARLEADDSDTEAKEELSRLNSGQPLKALMNAAQRKEAAATEALTKLRELMDTVPQADLRKLSKQTLEEGKKQWDEIEKRLRAVGKTLPEDAREYRKELHNRLLKYSTRTAIRCVYGIGAIAASTAAFFLINSKLRDGAYADMAQLEAALNQKNWQQAQNLRDKTDSKLNHYYCPELQSLLKKTDDWLAEIENDFKKLDADIRKLEQKQHGLKEIGLKGQVELENRLRRLIRGRDILQQRWTSLCKKERHMLEQQKKEILQAVHAPLPKPPELTGDTALDDKSLRQHQTLLQERLAEAKLAHSAYNCAHDIIADIEQRIHKQQVLLNDIKAFSSTAAKLKKERSYDTYCAVIRSFTPAEYPAALQITTITPLLPTQEDIVNRILDPQGEFSPKLLLAARQTLTNGGPTFTADFPANHRQIVLMEDMFTAPSLYRKVYGIELPDTTMRFSTKKPTIDKTNFIIFRTSNIDPNFSPDDDVIELQNDGRVELVEYDATPLLKCGDFTRERFFITANILQLLTNALNFPEGKHPALAQAYVYYTLLQLANEHTHPLLNGARFSPTLKTHAADFHRILKKSGITLEPGCWLTANHTIKHAGQAFAEWFRRHKGADYLREAAAEFSSRYEADSFFTGYVDEKGNFCPFRRLDAAQFLWFVTKTGMKRTPANAPDFTEAMPWSPVFSEVRPTGKQ